MKRKKRKSHPTPDERSARRESQRVLEDRIRALETELHASGSVYAGVPRDDVLDFATRRIEAELAAKQGPA